MEQRRRWDGKRKVKWLREQAEKMASDPVYWPASKKSRPNIGTDMILDALKNGPRTKDELIRITGKTATAIASVTQSMAKAGEIMRARPGVFALPTADAVAHIGGSEAVVAALTTAGRAMSTRELVAATGKPRSAVDAALHRLRESGAVVTIRRGLFALAPKAAAG
jgi:biotin operon repressor